MAKNVEETSDDELRDTESGATGAETGTDGMETAEGPQVVLHKRKPRKPSPAEDADDEQESDTVDASQTSVAPQDAKEKKSPDKASRKRRKAADTPADDLNSDERGALATFRELTSDRSEFRQNLSLRHILGGDILTVGLIRRQIWLILLIFALTVGYISNRYASQQEMLELTNLREQLTDLKYDALSRSSELTEKSRLSHIEDFLIQMNDSLVQGTPYIINAAK